MNGWDDLEEWVEGEIESLVKEAKDEAGEVFLRGVTSPTSQHPSSSAFGSGGFTPVYTGNLIANTEVGINSMPDGKNSFEDESGKETFFDGFVKIKSADAWDKVYFVNNTPYNIQAEFTGWEKDGQQTTKPYRYWTLSYNNVLETIK